MKELGLVFEILLKFIQLFPRLFANMFSFVPIIGIYIKYLPQFIELAKSIIEAVNIGMTEIQIQIAFKRISNAMKNPDRIKAARDLNRVFKE